MTTETQLKFRDKKTQKIVEDWDLYVDSRGNVKRVYEDENEEGALCEYVADENDLEVVVCYGSLCLGPVGKSKDEKKPLFDVSDIAFFGEGKE